MKRSKFVVKNGRSRGAKIQKEWGLLGYPAGCIEPGVDGFVELFSPACVSGAAWLGLLAFLPAGVVHVSLWWGGVWCGWVAKRGLCWATRRCSCQSVREGHRTHQTTILLEVSFSFSFSSCKVPSCLLVLTSPKHNKGRWVTGIEEASFSMSVHPFECVVG